jgi:hypothetical protein
LSGQFCSLPFGFANYFGGLAFPFGGLSLDGFLWVYTNSFGRCVFDFDCGQN